MAITDSAIQRVRARIEAFDADPKQVEAFKQLASQRAQLRDLAAAIGTFVDGGGLRDFATAYGSPLQSGWDVWLVNNMVDQLSNHQGGPSADGFSGSVDSRSKRGIKRGKHGHRISIRSFIMNNLHDIRCRRQSGQVYLSDRKVRVERPRLRRRGQGTGGEVEVPAYEAMNRPGPVGQRMLEILLAGVSTRKYARVIPAMAETVGVSRSAVSRETIEASERVLEELMERRLDGWDLLVIYLDGIQFGDYHVLGAVGVDVEGKKHVLGVREGASENAEVARALLEDLVVRGVDTGRRRLFVLDGSKALRSALDQVFGRQHPVQRCRNHKARNVVGHLPKELQAQARATMRAAWKLEAKEGEQKLDQFARWLERDHPSAAASLREGLGEMFTINRLGLPLRLRHCLTSTNLIDSTHSGVRQKTHRVTNWKNGTMALRWAASSFVETEKSYRKIIGHQELWMLKAHLDDRDPAVELKKAG